MARERSGIDHSQYVEEVRSTDELDDIWNGQLDDHFPEQLRTLGDAECTEFSLAMRVIHLLKFADEKLLTELAQWCVNNARTTEPISIQKQG